MIAFAVKVCTARRCAATGRSFISAWKFTTLNHGDAWIARPPSPAQVSCMYASWCMMHTFAPCMHAPKWRAKYRDANVSLWLTCQFQCVSRNRESYDRPFAVQVIIDGESHVRCFNFQLHFYLCNATVLYVRCTVVKLLELREIHQQWDKHLLCN